MHGGHAHITLRFWPCLARWACLERREAWPRDGRHAHLTVEMTAGSSRSLSREGADAWPGDWTGDRPWAVAVTGSGNVTRPVSGQLKISQWCLASEAGSDEVDEHDPVLVSLAGHAWQGRRYGAAVGRSHMAVTVTGSGSASEAGFHAGVGHGSVTWSFSPHAGRGQWGLPRSLGMHHKDGSMTGAVV